MLVRGDDPPEPPAWRVRRGGAVGGLVTVGRLGAVVGLGVVGRLGAVVGLGPVGGLGAVVGLVGPGAGAKGITGGFRYWLGQKKGE